MPLQDQCSDAPLRVMLDSDQQADHFAKLLEHVAQCPHCQRRLEELAADQDHWSRAAMELAEFSSSDRLWESDSLSSIHDRQSFHSSLEWSESMARQLLSPPTHPEMLGRIGRYEVERLIGSGGMGIVFKANDTELNRPVAIKILAPYLAGNGTARQRFAREARAAAAVVHEHVVPIHNVETDGQSPFLVMRFVAGESLQKRIDRDGPLDTRQTLRIAMQVAAGLAAAHAQGLVHRDIKPSNILVEYGVDRSLITDFGLARAADDASLTHSGYHAGTPQYMSPEQARGEATDARSDLFSLGSVIYTMCTGSAPFRAETSYGVLRRITDNEPRKIQEINPDVPAWLSAIVAKLMAKSPELRFQSANELVGVLEACLAHVQQPAAINLPSSVAALPGTHVGRRRTRPLYRFLAGWAGLACLSILAVARLMPTGPVHPSDATTQSQTSTSKPADENTRTQPRLPAKIPSDDSSVTQPEVRRPRQPLREDPSDRIRVKLVEPIEVSFRDLRLAEAIELILKKSQVNFRFSNEVQEALQNQSDSLASLAARGSAASLLAWTCELYGTTYVVGDTGIEIVTLESARQHPVLRFYDLAYLFPDNRLDLAVTQAIVHFLADRQSVDLVDGMLLVRATEAGHIEIERLLSQFALDPIPTPSQ